MIISCDILPRLKPWASCFINRCPFMYSGGLTQSPTGVNSPLSVGTHTLFFPLDNALVFSIVKKDYIVIIKCCVRFYDGNRLLDRIKILLLTDPTKYVVSNQSFCITISGVQKILMILRSRARILLK